MENASREIYNNKKRAGFGSTVIVFQQWEANFDKNQAGAAGREGHHGAGEPTIIFI